MIQTSGDDRRAELSDFLRTRRARLSPSDVGLVDGRRRRTPGLRREEVALLANMGATWYTRLEQGLPINVSADVLESIATALRLSPSERRHLFTLACHPLPEDPQAPDEIVSDLVRRTLTALEPNPAFVRGRHWDLLAYNRAWQSTLCYFPDEPAEGQNLLWSFFTRPEPRVRHPQWEIIGPSLVAQFRSIAARYPEDPKFRDLIERLSERSDQFRRWWAQHDVSDVTQGMKQFFHPELGELILDHTTFFVPNFPDMRMIVYTAEPGSPSERKLHLLAQARNASLTTAAAVAP